MDVRTAERLCFLAVVTYLQWQVLWHGYLFSQEVAAKVSLPGLRAELATGLRNDLSDYQWRDFRGSLAPLAAALSAYVGLSRMARSLLGGRAQPLGLLLSLGFLGALHDSCALYVLALVVANYVISQRIAGTRAGLLMIWAFNCLTLVLARVSEGLPFERISPALAPLDRHRGMLRWHIHYNLLVLRMLSYSADLHWARLKRPGRPLTSKAAAVPPTLGGHVGRELELRARVETHLSPGQYGLVPYLLYLLYPPLYVAGPIITYNSFTSQAQAPLRVRPTEVARYALRWLLAWLCLEALTHGLYYNAIAKHRVLDYLTAAGLMRLRPVHYAYTGYWVLIFMWLKFLVIWRFFRLVALADGLVAPENMTRCVANNYDVEGFWRSWHASYNQWLVRYMYVPLGGGAWRAANVWPIFTFVALWHDLEWRMLGWAWAMAAAIAPEMAVKALGRSSFARRWHGTAAFRYAAAAAATVNILILMAANLTGFVVGVEGIGPLAAQVLGQPGFLAVVLLALFSGVQLMFWKRDAEQEAAAARRQQE